MKGVAFALVALGGCGEQWVAWDELEVPITGPGVVSVRVTTTPEAWPKHLTDDAVRASFDAGDCRLMDPDHEILQEDPSWVNVLDAWDACDPTQLCVTSFRFALDCEAECDGLLLIDAFLATSSFAPSDRTGSLSLERVDDPEEQNIEPL